MTTYRLGIIGAAGHVHLVLDELDRFPNIQYVACAPSWPEEDISRLASRGAPNVTLVAYDDWQDMLARGGLDIAVVAGRHDLGAEISIAALAQGCHVISDKPAAQNLPDLERLREAIAEANVARHTIYTLMLPLRLWPAFWTAKQLVAQGAIGEPQLVTGQKSYRWGNARPAWYADPAMYGSTITWVGIHAFDFARWVTGLDYCWVSAQHATKVHRERPGCQDVATVMAGLSNGGAAVFNLDYLRPEQASTHGDDRLRVAGSKGVIEVTHMGQKVHLINENGDQPDMALESAPRSFFGDIVHAIETGAEPAITVEEALSISAFAIQASSAAQTGQRITL